MGRFLTRLPLLALALLAGCDTMPPEGPTVTALPGDAKSPAEFRSNDMDCRQYARAQADEAASAAHAATATSGLMDAGGRPGSVIDGIDSAQYVGYGLQQPYNRAYVRCMYVKGNRVPLLARERWPAPRSPWPPDPDAYYFPLQR
ncbi:MAG TPA: hypothetical protein VG429_01065 [Casimicrobiaceae bacterium]|jgi:hypothetical protein|nr:hypothetical protein [Casimicrobiaceae bacterium]